VIDNSIDIYTMVAMVVRLTRNKIMLMAIVMLMLLLLLSASIISGCSASRPMSVRFMGSNSITRSSCNIGKPGAAAIMSTRMLVEDAGTTPSPGDSSGH
jgi:uncharacterized membrane protein